MSSQIGVTVVMILKSRDTQTGKASSSLLLQHDDDDFTYRLHNCTKVGLGLSPFSGFEENMEKKEKKKLSLSFW